METLANNNWATQRRHELDWLRVLAFGLLIVYHLGMAYVAEWGWHVKSQYQSELLQYLMLWSNQWRMSLLFLISGAAISYQLHRSASTGFLSSTAKRLLIPLVFGSLVIVAPQSYIETISKTTLNMSYGEFWWAYLSYGDLPPAYGRFDSSNIIYNHLWYLLYLFAYAACLWCLYPLYARLAQSTLARWLAPKLPLWLILVLPALVFFAIGELLWESYPTTHMLIDDWFNNARYFFVFFLGFALVRSNRFWQSFTQYRLLALALACVTYAIIVCFKAGILLSEYVPVLSAYEGYVKGLVFSANAWFWIVTVVGYAQRYLNRPNQAIQTLNGAVYCYYILHQTIIVVAVYALSSWQLGPAIEPAVVLLLTLVGCQLGFLLASRWQWLSVVMGVRYKAPSSAVSTSQGIFSVSGAPRQ